MGTLNKAEKISFESPSRFTPKLFAAICPLEPGNATGLTSAHDNSFLKVSEGHRRCVARYKKRVSLYFIGWKKLIRYIDLISVTKWETFFKWIIRGALMREGKRQYSSAHDSYCDWSRQIEHLTPRDTAADPKAKTNKIYICLLYTSDAADE